MSGHSPKQLLQDAFDHLARGDGSRLIALMSEDFCWTLTGTTAWSRTYRGKQAVRQELFAPLFAQFADTYVNNATRFIAEHDLVVVESRGSVTTKAGHPYNNAYCMVCRFAGDKLVELTEYLDTELVAKALQPPTQPLATPYLE